MVNKRINRTGVIVSDGLYYKVRWEGNKYAESLAKVWIEVLE